jgi:Zn-dependent protease
MKWSWRLGEFAGIGVYVHATFFLMIGWVALSHWTQRHSLAATLAGVGFILAIFACVVLHEFGHALAARRYGIKTRDITLLHSNRAGDDYRLSFALTRRLPGACD